MIFSLDVIHIEFLPVNSAISLDWSRRRDRNRACPSACDYNGLRDGVRRTAWKWFFTQGSLVYPLNLFQNT